MTRKQMVINTSLFTTNPNGLFDVFLDNLPQEAKQHYNCKSCRNFVESYDGLVAITDNGETISALWGEVTEFFAPSVQAIAKKLEDFKTLNRGLIEYTLEAVEQQ